MARGSELRRDGARLCNARRRSLPWIHGWSRWPGRTEEPEVNLLKDLLRELPERHRAALQWFADRAGEEHSWPQPITVGGDATLLASKAKGIYKPEWTKYALSVRQTLGGPYPDRDPEVRLDGTWSYEYFQENKDTSARDQEFTNLGLVACWQDRVPVGVMRQVAGKPHVRYRVLGLALVTGWDAGYFSLEGFSPDGACREPGLEVDVLITIQDEGQSGSGAFDPARVKDARERVMASVVRRLGQPAFRSMLIRLYRGKCALTGCDVQPVLEAAHITPYGGAETNHPTNGILLRSDIHVLFDLGLIAIDPTTRQVIIAPSLKGTIYGELEGRVIAEPSNPQLQPSVATLVEHLRRTRLRIQNEG